jgi:hypothetical protein
MSPLQRALYTIVVKAFERGAFTPTERLDLTVINGNAGLTADEVDDVFRALLRGQWGDVIDEDTLDAADWAKLALVASALRLPRDRVPFPAELGVAI